MGKPDDLTIIVNENKFAPSGMQAILSESNGCIPNMIEKYNCEEAIDEVSKNLTIKSDDLKNNRVTQEDVDKRIEIATAMLSGEFNFYDFTGDDTNKYENYMVARKAIDTYLSEMYNIDGGYSGMLVEIREEAERQIWDAN